MGDTVIVKLFRLTLSAVVLATIAGCSAEQIAAKDPTSQRFELPAGVTLSEGGGTLEIGQSATVVYQVADQTRSAITVTVDEIKKGTIKDFRFFSLDEESRAATPYYVVATLHNEGPSGLGGVAVPLYAHDSSNSIMPPNNLVGDFEPCPNRELPASLLPGEEATVCLVYLIPEGTSLVSIDLQTTVMDKPIFWKP